MFLFFSRMDSLFDDTIVTKKLQSLDYVICMVNMAMQSDLIFLGLSLHMINFRRTDNSK